MRLLRGLAKVAVVVLVLAGVALLSLYLRVPVEKPFAYWLIRDQTLGILVGDSQNVGCAVSLVDASSDGITIHAQCWERLVPVPQAAALQAYVMEVILPAPLGSRQVINGLGQLGTLCSSPYPDCTIPR